MYKINTKEMTRFLTMRYPHSGTSKEKETFFEVYGRVVAYPILQDFSKGGKK